MTNGEIKTAGNQRHADSIYQVRRDVCLTYFAASQDTKQDFNDHIRLEGEGLHVSQYDPAGPVGAERTLDTGSGRENC